MKKFIISILLIFSPILPSLAYAKTGIGQTQHSLRCCSEIRDTLDQIQQLEEVNDLIQEILKEGPLSIKINHPQAKKQFDGCWSGDNRTIYVTHSKNTPRGLLLSTLLFELHNAKRNYDLQNLDREAQNRKIKKKNYVRAVEQLEFENVHDTTKLINKGKRLGVFPKNCYWNYPDDFEEHLQIQKSSGHSKWIADGYDQMRW